MKKSQIETLVNEYTILSRKVEKSMLCLNMTLIAAIANYLGVFIYDSAYYTHPSIGSSF